MPDSKKARAVGLNHIALEVGDIDEALSFMEGSSKAVKCSAQRAGSALVEADQVNVLLPISMPIVATVLSLALLSMARAPCAQLRPQSAGRSTAGPFH